MSADNQQERRELIEGFQDLVVKMKDICTILESRVAEETAQLKKTNKLERVYLQERIDADRYAVKDFCKLIEEIKKKYH